MASTFDSSSLYEQLDRTRQDFWNSHAYLPEAQRKQLWLQAASCSNSAYGTSNDSMAHQIPRSMLSTSSMTQLPTTDYGLIDQTYSTPMLGRSTSATGSDSINMERSASGWHSMSQEPANDYVLFSGASMRKQQSLQPIAEGSYSNESVIEWNPDDYVSNLIEPASSSSLPSSLSMHSQQLQLTPNLQQWSPSSEISTAPSTPSTALTPLTHSSNPMSRQSSYNSHLLDATSMLRIHSDSSCMLPSLLEDGAVSFDSFNVDSKTIDGSSFPTFTGSTSETFLSSPQSVLPSAHALAPFENDTSYLAEDMRRSTSTTYSESNLSDASAPSTSSRHSRREREINAQASRKIAPKAIESNDETESTPSNAQMAEIMSQDGSSKTVGVLTKTPYVRPQHPKIMCQFCQERPEGFRGTHELERHVNRAHAPSRKGYICIDASNNKFLANCKHCRNKKVYGAYYNAAAHLRRAHFHPRKRGRKGKNEKRGGIGGGDDPPMDLLRMHWIREVDIDNKTPSSPESASDDAADNSYQSTFDIDASYPAQQAIPTPIITQTPVDTNQYVDYGMSVNATEPVIYDASTYNYDNIASANDINSFQFDAYM